MTEMRRRPLTVGAVATTAMEATRLPWQASLGPGGRSRSMKTMTSARRIGTTRAASLSEPAPNGPAVREFALLPHSAFQLFQLELSVLVPFGSHPLTSEPVDLRRQWGTVIVVVRHDRSRYVRRKLPSSGGARAQVGRHGFHLNLRQPDLLLLNGDFSTEQIHAFGMGRFVFISHVHRLGVADILRELTPPADCLEFAVLVRQTDARLLDGLRHLGEPHFRLDERLAHVPGDLAAVVRRRRTAPQILERFA